MSWDVLAIDLPPGAESLDDIPEGFEPRPLGKRSEIIAKITAAMPTADFDDPSWGHISGVGWHIEVNIGNDETCENFMLHVRGGEGSVAAVATILEAVGVRALDLGSGGPFFEVESALASFRDWRSYRDAVSETLNGADDSEES